MIGQNKINYLSYINDEYYIKRALIISNFSVKEHPLYVNIDIDYIISMLILFQLVLSEIFFIPFTSIFIHPLLLNIFANVIQPYFFHVLNEFSVWPPREISSRKFSNRNRDYSYSCLINSPKYKIMRKQKESSKRNEISQDIIIRAS